MLHWGTAAFGHPVFCSLVVLTAATVTVVRQRVEARRRAQGRERRLWFDYATLAAQTAREMRGEPL